MLSFAFATPTHTHVLLLLSGFRLRRNYGLVFVVLLGGWLLKLAMHPTVAGSLDEIWQRMGVGWRRRATTA